MHSPQKEDGYTPIANILFEAFYCAKFTEYERVCVMHIWRKTYGWSKKEDWIANSQFAEETGIPKPHVTRTLKALKEKNIVTSSGNKITVNKRYYEWKVKWRKLPHQVTGVTSPGNKKLPHQVPTKTSKANIQKQLGETSSPELKDNQKDMPWNQTSDDHLEGVVDYDGDGSLAEEKKPQTRKYPNAPAIRKVFQEVLGKNPASWNKNKTVLQSCEDLFTERGVDKVRNALVFYKEHEDEEFCPAIDSPVDLLRKYEKLSRFSTKKNGN